MSNVPIHDWSEAFVVLKQRAEETRGFVELNPGTPDRERWPRTTGADVVAIAAVVDEHVRRLRPSHGVHGVVRRWATCLAELERFALVSPGDTYAGNRALWRCLAQVFVHLASVNAPLPDPVTWAVLIVELGNVLAIRNVGPKGDGPFKHFDNVKTFHDLFLAQEKFLRETRGYDELEPDPIKDDSYGTGGSKWKIPRTTNVDVLALAGYWGTQLDDVKEVFGHAGVKKRFDRAMADVMKIAMYANPTAVYPKNNAFWRELSNTAVHVSVADEAPSKWDMAIDSVKDSVKKLPDRIAGGAKAVAETAGDIAQGVGKIVNKAGQGLFSGLGVPLLIGGGLIGLFLISRSRGRKEEE